MADKFTPFDQFKKLKADRDASRDRRDQAARQDAVEGTLSELAALVNDTGQLVQALEEDIERALARAVASGRPMSRDALIALARLYERRSWRLHGLLRALIDASRRY